MKPKAYCRRIGEIFPQSKQCKNSKRHQNMFFKIIFSWSHFIIKSWHISKGFKYTCWRIITIYEWSYTLQWWKYAFHILRQIFYLRIFSRNYCCPWDPWAWKRLKLYASYVLLWSEIFPPINFSTVCWVFTE